MNRLDQAEHDARRAWLHLEWQNRDASRTKRADVSVDMMVDRAERVLAMESGGIFHTYHTAQTLHAEACTDVLTALGFNPRLS